MSLQLFNTLTGEKQTFVPLNPGKVGVYVCGPTVYDMSHIGHARCYVAFDVIIRYLRRVYGAANVTYVRNFTDVDDKIIKKALATGEAPNVVSERYTEEFRHDMASLNCTAPDIEPKVTEHIPEIIALIAKLIEKDVAYESAGDVYYSVTAFPRYGALGRRSLDDMEAGARVEVSEIKRNPLDFALWKAAKPGEPSWQSPWGAGRPGWHIECSAMNCKYLGETFDIHGGGKDLIFPHHENEVAQSEAASGKQLSRYWLHNGFVNIDNEKMSKSLGNFFTIRDVLQKFDAQAVRYYLLCTHYRSAINFSDQALRESEARVQYLYETLLRLESCVTAGSSSGPYREAWVETLTARFAEAMDDDFNTPRALGDISEAFRLINEIIAKPGDAETDARTLRALREQLHSMGEVLGVFNEKPQLVLDRMSERRQAERGVTPAAIEALIAERNNARQARNFARADEIRQELLTQGIVIKDGPTGTSWTVV